jgi:hypothetical protein
MIPSRRHEATRSKVKRARHRREAFDPLDDLTSLKLWWV